MPTTFFFFQLLDDRGPVPSSIADWVITIQGDVIRIMMPPNWGQAFAQKTLEELGYNVTPMPDQQAAAEAFVEAMNNTLE